MKLLLDMNLSPSWVATLEQAGFEAIHWSQVGKHNAPDRELFAWARQHQHIVFTHDLDFGAMLALTGAESPSVFQVRTQDATPDTLAIRVISVLQRFHVELETGALVVVDDVRERVRILPLALR